jgi:hypothetical protein
LSAQLHQNIKFYRLSSALDSFLKDNNILCNVDITAHAAQGNTAQEAMMQSRHKHTRKTRRDNKITTRSTQQEHEHPLK